MARTNIPIQALPVNGGQITGVTFTAADAVNGMSFVNDGRTILLIKNTDAATHLVTVVSVPDRFGRSGDTTVTAPIGNVNTSFSIAGPFAGELFGQVGGVANVNFAAATGMSVACIQLAPGNP